jgi:hypothetical protein
MSELLPRDRPSACAAVQTFLPDTLNYPIEPPYTMVVRRSSVVLVVSTEFLIQTSLLLLQRIVAMFLAPESHSSQATLQALTHRPYVDR